MIFTFICHTLWFIGNLQYPEMSYIMDCISELHSSHPFTHMFWKVGIYRLDYRHRPAHYKANCAHWIKIPNHAHLWMFIRYGFLKVKTDSETLQTTVSYIYPSNNTSITETAIYWPNNFNQLEQIIGSINMDEFHEKMLNTFVQTSEGVILLPVHLSIVSYNALAPWQNKKLKRPPRRNRRLQIKTLKPKVEILGSKPEIKPSDLSEPGPSHKAWSMRAQVFFIIALSILSHWIHHQVIELSNIIMCLYYSKCLFYCYQSALLRPIFCNLNEWYLSVTYFLSCIICD